MNKKLLLTLILGMFLISFVSAGITYVEDNQTYVIDTWVPTWLGGNGESTVKLESNTDQCLINCGFHLSGFNEEAVSLVDDIDFVNRRGQDVSDKLKSISFQLGTYQEVEKYNTTYETICEDIYNENSSNYTESCHQELISNETYYINELVWMPYEGQKVSGYWELKATAQKEKVSMDWIVTFRGKELSEWAWWDTDWSYKRQINLTADAGDFSYLFEIEYDSDMNSNYSDLRFLNGAEDTEFNYTIQKYNTTRAVVRVFSQGETSFYIYYGNPTATSTSSASDTHFNPVSMYYMDETSGSVLDAVGTNDGTNNGATRGVTGKINNAFDFDGTDDEITTPITFGNNDPLTFNIWVKTTTDKEQDLIGMRGDASATGLLTYIQFQPSDIVRFRIQRGDLDTDISFNYNDNNWHMYTLTFDGSSTGKAYIDGDDVGTNVAIGTGTGDRNVGIGRLFTHLSLYFDETIDEVGIWSRALSSDEISYLYNYTSPTYTVGDEELKEGVSVTLLSPKDDVVLENTSQSFNATVTPTDLNLTNATFNLWKNNSGTYEIFDTETATNFTNSTEENNITFDITGIERGEYIWGVSSCGESLTSSDIICSNSINRSFTTQEMSLNVSLYYPLTDEEIENTGINHTANYSITNGSMINTTYFVWDEDGDLFNQTTETLTAAQTSSTLLINNYVAGFYNWTVTACASNSFYTLCQTPENETFRWIPFATNSETFNNDTYETKNETFQINITTIEEILSVTANLDYNGTDYVGVVSCNGNTCIINREIDIPKISSSSENITWNWEITVFDGSTSFAIESDNHNQTISQIVLIECNATYVNKSLNFTSYDEANLSKLEPFMFEGNFDYWLGSGTIKKNYYLGDTSTNEVDLCISPADEDFYIDGIISYDSSVDIYTERSYYFDNYKINNTLQDIELLLLKSEDSTSFIQEVLENQIGIQDALIYTYKYYPGINEFKITQVTKTDSNGETVGFYESEVSRYKHDIYLDETLIYTESEAYKVIPTSTPYTITFNLGTPVGTPFEQYDDELGLSKSLSYNPNTYIVTYSYTDINSTNSGGRLLIQQENYASDDELISNETSSLSSATLTYNMTGESGNFIAQAFVTRNGEEILVDTIRFTIDDKVEIFEEAGVLLGWFIILVAMMAFIYDAVVGLVAVNLAIVFTNLIGFISFGLTFIFGILITSIIIIWLLKK